MLSGVLSDRDTNQTMASNPFNNKDNTATENTKPKSMDFQRQLMENKLRENEGNPTNAYVSPSDAIMSPASQKLSGFKQRQMNKSNPVKPRSLFAKPATTREKDLGPEEPEKNESN